MFKERLSRTLLKTISWRVCATVTTVIAAYAISGSINFAASMGAVEVIAKSLFYYLHERAWDSAKVGRYALSSNNLQPFVLWFTGLPSSGKSTLAENLVRELYRRGVAVKELDGDVVRKIVVNSDFSKQGRNAHIKKMGDLALQFEKHGIPVVASFVSPYRESRDYIRKISTNFVEVYVATPLQLCENRDVKGMYRKARDGEMNNFTGVDDPYEPPLSPELTIDTTDRTVEDCVSQILSYLTQHGFVSSKSVANS